MHRGYIVHTHEWNEMVGGKNMVKRFLSSHNMKQYVNDFWFGHFGPFQQPAGAKNRAVVPKVLTQ